MHLDNGYKHIVTGLIQQALLQNTVTKVFYQIT